ncbi:unnamed protein product [Ranitomeya imitator]|uniref:EGF-like domain-containing protein n=1 Tax=Ranitomeya imitator TaxID=111125 RepID=A0ABN9MPH5_9NEOB|nr:unnamed protein product [Ranitomeya imitator]
MRTSQDEVECNSWLLKLGNGELSNVYGLPEDTIEIPNSFIEEGNGTHCDDDNECETSNSCSPNATCTNTIGNYSCTCKNGFSGDGTHCADIDECKTTNNCSPYATCTNTIGSYKCTCNDGFSGTLCYHDFVLLAESSGMQSGISAP